MIQHDNLALLRGINVGGNKKVAMSELKKLFASLGYTTVSTYINSGNVLFKSAATLTGKARAHEARLIETALEKHFGFTITVMLRTASELLDLAAHIPKTWANDTEQRTDILFLADAYDSANSIQLAKHTAVDTLKYHSGALMWNVSRVQYSKSGLHAFIGSELYKNMTARNVNTVRTLARLFTERAEADR